MPQTVSWLHPEHPLFLITAVATHLVMSFAQTVMHYTLGHHPIGGKFFRNHINFHHTYYSKDHLVSRTYLGDEGNNTPFFFIPVFLGDLRVSMRHREEEISHLSLRLPLITPCER